MSTPGYYCVICHKWLQEQDGVIVHDPVPHPPDMTFDEQENPMRDTADIKNLHYHAFAGSWLKRNLAGNSAGALVDSVVFPTLAFGALMPEIVALQFLAKVAGGSLWGYLINKKLAA